jgi:hypothetical protein
MASEPVTVDMLQPANVNYRVPDHGAMTDWAGGATGNDIDTSNAAATINSAAPTTVPDYVPRTQYGKLALGNLTPGTVMATDIGMDYGQFSGEFGRTGTIEPRSPYPNSLTP